MFFFYFQDWRFYEKYHEKRLTVKRKFASNWNFSRGSIRARYSIRYLDLRELVVANSTPIRISYSRVACRTRFLPLPLSPREALSRNFSNRWFVKESSTSLNSSKERERNPSPNETEILHGVTRDYSNFLREYNRSLDLRASLDWSRCVFRKQTVESSRLVVLVMESHSRLREERFSLECRIIASSFRDAVQPHSHFNVSLMALGSCRRIKIEHWSQEGRNVEWLIPCNTL